METVLKFDKVILTKELNDKIKKVGEVFEIANILDNSFLLRDGKTRIAVGVVSFEDFEKHFVPVGNFKGWTDWTKLMTDYEDGLIVFYRVKDRHKIQVKTSNGYIGESYCNNKFGDEFNLHFGLNLAFLRCMKKMYLGKINDCQEKINIYSNEIRELESKIKNFN